MSTIEHESQRRSVRQGDEHSEDVQSISVPSDADGTRLDVYLSGFLKRRSRTEITELIKSGNVLLNSQTTRPSRRVRKDDQILLRLPPEKGSGLIPWDFEISVVYEDDELIVIDKPAGMLVHPVRGELRQTLTNAVSAHYPGERILPVHRLDRETSGLIVFGRTRFARSTLARAFEERRACKTYLAIVHGRAPRRGKIDLPLGRSTDRHPPRVVAQSEGRSALTSFRTCRSTQDRSLLIVRPHTGRTHQIRVHLASIGHPVLGDRLYAGTVPPAPPAMRQRLALHAAGLRIRHPERGHLLRLRAPVPEDLAPILDSLSISPTV